MAKRAVAAPPPSFIVRNPKCQNYKFAGRYLNLKLLAKHLGINHGYMSRIMSGERTPSVAYALLIANALHLSLDEFVEAVRERKANPTPRLIPF